jgi:uncharacterized protein YecT (DUF1311 family)
MARAGDTLKPPLIREPFAALPCPLHPRTTVEIVRCSEKALLNTDRAIDARTSVIFNTILPAFRPSFVRSERAWLNYRRTSCWAETSNYVGGSGHPISYLDCQVARNHTHQVDLARLLSTIRQH